MTSQECLDLIKSKGCRPANIWELLEYVNTHKLEKDSYLIAFGSQWVDSDGFHRVPYVRRSSDGGFGFDLGFFEIDWDDGYCLLAFQENIINKNKITLSQGAESIIDEDNYNELSKYSWHLSSEGYARRIENINGKKITISMHSFINKTPKGFQTDHINGNKLDNRKENLATVTWSENQIKAKVRSDNTSGLKCIRLNKLKWEVACKRKCKRNYIGHFNTKEEAIKAFKKFCDSKTSEPLALGNSTLETLVDLKREVKKVIAICNNILENL
jgi:hypothetical protein